MVYNCLYVHRLPSCVTKKADVVELSRLESYSDRDGPGRNVKDC